MSSEMRPSAKYGKVHLVLELISAIDSELDRAIGRGGTMPGGKLTARMARKLTTELEPRGFEILFDHGQQGIDHAERLGEIVSWFGDKYDSESRLAVLDVAVVSPDSNKVIAPIEIEETASSPKVLIGDVMATLLGDHIKFQGKRDLEVGKWTTLIVLANSERQRPVLKFLQTQLDNLKSSLRTPNASVGHLVLETFTDDSNLEKELTKLIHDAIRYSGVLGST